MTTHGTNKAALARGIESGFEDGGSWVGALAAGDKLTGSNDNGPRPVTVAGQQPADRVGGQAEAAGNLAIRFAGRDRRDDGRAQGFDFLGRPTRRGGAFPAGRRGGGRPEFSLELAEPGLERQQPNALERGDILVREAGAAHDAGFRPQLPAPRLALCLGYKPASALWLGHAAMGPMRTRRASSVGDGDAAGYGVPGRNRTPMGNELPGKGGEWRRATIGTASMSAVAAPLEKTGMPDRPEDQAKAAAVLIAGLLHDMVAGGVVPKAGVLAMIDDAKTVLADAGETGAGRIIGRLLAEIDRTDAPSRH